MNPARRLRVIAPLLTVGMLTAAVLGSATTASACSSAACLGVNPDLSVALTATPNPVAAGGTHTYKLSVTNVTLRSLSPVLPGRPVPGADVSNVQVNLASFGSDESLVSSQDTSGDGFVCYTYPEAVGGMDTRCVSGHIATGTTAQITLTMRGPSRTGAYTTSATVDPYNQIAESNETNNTATVGFTVN